MNAQDFVKPEQLEAAVKAGQETLEKAVKASKDATNQAYKASADAAAKGYEQGLSVTRGQVETMFPAAVDKFDEVAKANKDFVDAMFATGAIATKGFEAFGDEIAAANKKAVETSVAGAKALAGVKSYQDLADVQQTYAKQAFDQMVAEATKFAELTAKIANEAASPLQARWTEAAKTVAKTTAAK